MVSDGKVFSIQFVTDQYLKKKCKLLGMFTRKFSHQDSISQSQSPRVTGDKGSDLLAAA